MLGEVLAAEAVSCAGAAVLGVGAVSIGAGAVAIGAGVVIAGAGVESIGSGIVAAGAGAVLAGAAAVLICAGAGATDADLVTFLSGSVAFTGAACGRDSAGAVGVSLPASASTVAELPFVVASAVAISGFTAVALASVAGLSGDDQIRFAMNAPPITVTVIAASATPKWLLMRPPVGGVYPLEASEAPAFG